MTGVFGNMKCKKYIFFFDFRVVLLRRFPKNRFNFFVFKKKNHDKDVEIHRCSTITLYSSTGILLKVAVHITFFQETVLRNQFLR